MECPRGKWQDQAAASTCTSCPLLESTPNAGATSNTCVGASSHNVSVSSCSQLGDALVSQTRPTTYQFGAGHFACPNLSEKSANVVWWKLNPNAPDGPLSAITIGPGTVVAITGAGYDQTTIDIAQNGWLFWITGGSVTLSNLRIKGASRLVIMVKEGYLSATSCEFRDNTNVYAESGAYFAGVVGTFSPTKWDSAPASVIFDSCRFFNNTGTVVPTNLAGSTAAIAIAGAKKGAIVFRNTLAMEENQPFPVTAQDGGTLLYEGKAAGAIFPERSATQGTFGKTTSGGIVLFRDLPTFNANHGAFCRLSPLLLLLLLLMMMMMMIMTMVLAVPAMLFSPPTPCMYMPPYTAVNFTEGGALNLPICPAYTDQTAEYRINQGTEVKSELQFGDEGFDR